MIVRVITGSNQEIARQVANLEGNVREAIVFVEEPAAQLPVPATADELFAEMEAYTVKVGDVDDSREAIYTRMEGFAGEVFGIHHTIALHKGC